MKLKALLTLSCVTLCASSCLAQPTNIIQYLFNGNPRRIPDSASGLDVLKLIQQTSGSNHVEQINLNEFGSIRGYVTNYIIIKAQPTMIQGEIDYVVRTNWINESVTRKLPENAGEYTMHQVGQVSTNIEARFVFDGQLHIVNLGIKLATNVYRRDRVFSKRSVVETPPIPEIMNTNNYGVINVELPYSQQKSRIP